jgi:hypothetical protein
MNVTLTRDGVTTVRAEKQLVLHILRGVFVALVTQHAKRMRRIILSSVTSQPLPYFSTLSHYRHDFREQKLNIKICVLILYNVRLEHSLF